MQFQQKLNTETFMRGGFGEGYQTAPGVLTPSVKNKITAHSAIILFDKGYHGY